MIYYDDSFIFMLQKIRERPGVYLGDKSLERLVQFWNGYVYGGAIKAWEMSHDNDFFENFDEAMNDCFSSKRYSDHFMYGFDEFVHSHYDCGLTSLNGAGLISKFSDSEADAFDRFFVLLDEFLDRSADAIMAH